MSNKIIKYSIILFGYLAVFYPLWTRFRVSGLAFDSGLITNLFPAFGLIAFSVLWLHVLSGVFEPWLRRYINFDRFVHTTSLIVLLSIILHPLLLLISMDFNVGNIFFYYGSKYIWLAIIGWLLLITYDIGKAFHKYDFFIRNWNKILIISTIGFLLTFFHSLGLGSDLQYGPLRTVWIFYGTTAIAGTIYTYGIKRFLN